MTAKPSQDQCLEISNFCVRYLYEKFSNEKNLFRSGVSQTDVRTLQMKLSQFTSSNKMREEFDPHLVAEVLIKSLKDMTHPLLLDVYDDVVTTELSEEDFDQTKEVIQKWIVKLPVAYFDLTSMLFRLLSKLAALDENESSLLQLAFCIAPPICRPVTSAYMSIRHMEDLKRARPVVSFLVENYDDIFFNLAPLRAAQTPMSPGDSGRGLSGSHSMLIDPPAPFSPAVMSPKSPSGSVSSRSGDESSSSGGGGDRSFHLVRPNLLVMIPPAGGAAPDSLSLEVDVDGYGGGKQPPGRHYSDAEWNILEGLVLHQVGVFLDQDLDSGFSGGAYSRDQHKSVDGSRGGSPKSLFNRSGQHTFSSSGGSTRAASNLFRSAVGESSTGGAGRRRQMVADCKAMRSQIFEFEQEWSTKHNRIPKTYERGAMQAVYTRYRDLKKDIRSLAAIDVQRLVRGHLARVRAGLVARRDPSSSRANRMVVAQSPVLGQSNSQKGLGNGGASSSGSSGSATADLYGRYRELLGSKRDLKRRLKRFDEEFVEAHGRQPKKADKEVIRPMYQKYHEVKAALEELKAQIEQSHGPLPEDLLDESGGGGAAAVGGRGALGKSGSGTRVSGGTDSEPEPLGAGALQLALSRSGSGGGGGGGGKYLSSDDEGGGGGADSAASRLSYRPDCSPGKPAHKQLATGADSSGTGGGGSSSSSLEALSLEKTNLHAYLKVYERDFNRLHGRPVMRQEDIQPVAHEYQRYKELKGLIRDMKHQAVGK